MTQFSKELKPQLWFLPGSEARDARQLARIFQAMTGGMPADKVIAAVSAKFEVDDERRQHDERPLQ